MAISKLDKQNLYRKVCGWILVFVAILIPATVVGMKNLDVGVDLWMVTRPIESVVSHHYNFSSYLADDIDMGNGKYSSIEPGYKILIYILSLVSPDAHLVLFMIQFLTMLFVVLFAYKMRDKTNMTFVVFLYMLFWYYMTFSMMRQSLAMAILFFGVALFWEKKYIWSVFWLLIAISVHTTSAIGIVIYGMIALSNSKINDKIKTSIYIVYTVIVTCFVLLFDQIVGFLFNTAHIIPERYEFYFTSRVGLGGWQMTVVIACFVIMALIYTFVGKRNRVDGRLITIFLITDFLLILLSYKSEFLYRMGYYFEYLGLFLLIPNLPLLTKNTLKRIGICVICITLLASVVLRRIIVHNWANMYPYRSDILHISLGDTKMDSDNSNQAVSLLGDYNMNKRKK